MSPGGDDSPFGDDVLREGRRLELNLDAFLFSTINEARESESNGMQKPMTSRLCERGKPAADGRLRL
jgi:hypothetical protein